MRRSSPPSPSGRGRVACVSPSEAHGGEKQTKVLQLINAYRFLGNRWAQLDPLKRQERPEVAELDPSYYGFTEADLSASFRTGSFDMGVEQATLREILEALRMRYCGHIGAEYMYIADVAQKRWIQARYEPPRAVPRYTPEEKRRFLDLHHRRRDAGTLPAYPLRRPEAFLARGRRSR